LAESALLQRGRAFVTLYAKGALRGCTGRLDCSLPLAECVSRLAIAAAYDDERFPPVSPDEELEIEVHVLTPAKRIADPHHLIAGEHGACLKWGAHRAILLPVVANRYQFCREQFLQALARKAGVPDTVYASSGWELDIFRDQSFRERPV
jgi:AmmeMemoRadiSam system protein A